MKKVIYLIRHSSPFVEIDNYTDYRNVSWEEYNKNMILSVEGEKKAEKLCLIEELKNINNIYASNSFRAIGTAKYISEANNTKIKLDDRINERFFGITKLNELPEEYNKKSFEDKNYKLEKGESLKDIDNRFNDFINDILSSNYEKSIIVIHGILLLSFLTNLCDYYFDDKVFNVTYNNKTIIDGGPKSPGIYKIVYNNNKVIDIDVIN